MKVFLFILILTWATALIQRIRPLVFLSFPGCIRGGGHSRFEL